MILWLASYPRSGNTFFRVLLKEVYGLYTHSIYQLMNPTEIYLGERLGLQDSSLTTLDSLTATPDYHIVKTHDLPQEDFPAIYLVRDGRDAIVSHAHYIQMYDWKLSQEEAQARFSETLRMLIETDAAFGGWAANVRAWTTRSTRTVVVHFEDLIATPLAGVRQAMHALGYLPPEAEQFSIKTFEQLHAEIPEFFRKGKSGTWRNEMPADLHNLFWERHGEVMRLIGYTDGQPS